MSACVVNETTPLVKIGGEESVATYSQRTVVTVSSSSSDDSSTAEAGEPKESQVLGSVVAFQASHSLQIKQGDVDGEPVEGVGTIMEDVVEEVQQAAGAILHELRDSEEGDELFLEMALTRNLSILPSDVTGSHRPLPQDDPTDPEDDLEAPLPLDAIEEGRGDTSSSPTALRYIMLLVAVIGLSAVGPLLQLQRDTTATMKIQWRMAGTALFLLPFALNEMYRQGVPRLTSSQWITFLLSTASYDVLTVCFVLSLDYTTVGNTVILANSWTLILLVGKFFVGDHVSGMETVGALVAFAGCALCSKDSAEGRGGDDGHGIWTGLFGDALAIASAFGGVGYLIFAKACRQHMPLYTFMFLTMAVGWLLILPVQMLVMGEHVTFDMDVNHGVGGFLHLQADRLPLEIIMVVVCNMVGTMGYVQATQHFDTLVVSSGALLEPVMAEFLAFFFGVSSLPGAAGWLGNAMVAGGTFAVVYAGGMSSKEKA